MKRKSIIFLLITVFAICLAVSFVLWIVYGNTMGTDALLVYEKIEGEEAYSVKGAERATSSMQTKLEIPAEHEGLPVVRVQENAFTGRTWVHEVVIPDSVISIGEEAFSGCENLSRITLGKGIKKIGTSAFDLCPKLACVYFQGSIADWCAIEFEPYQGYIFRSNPLSVGNHTSIESKEFYVQDQLVTDLVIPDGVTEIKEGAFYRYYNLTSVSIPDSVQKIDGYVFYGCRNLEDVSIGNGVRYVGRDPFFECEKLRYQTDGSLNYLGNEENPYVYLDGCNDTEIKNCTVQPFTKVIGVNVFFSCVDLAEVQLSDGLLAIGDWAFSGCRNLTNIVIPSSVRYVGQQSFSGCSALTNINLPDGITEIGNATFNRCSKLSGIVIPDSVTKIGAHAFNECADITGIVIPDGVTEIGQSAFRGCSRLTGIVIPDGVTEIGEKTFEGCSSLVSIALPAQLKQIGESAFYQCNRLERIDIPQTVTRIGAFAFCRCTDLKEITVAKNNTVYQSIDGNLYSKDGKILIAYAIGREEEVFCIPEGVVKIEEEAFSHCKKLKSVAISGSVTEIALFAFFNCSEIESITVSKSVTSIAQSAFLDCDSLKTVFYTGTLKEWEQISVAAGNDRLTQATVCVYSEKEPGLNSDGAGYLGSYWHYVDGNPELWVFQP